MSTEVKLILALIIKSCVKCEKIVLVFVGKQNNFNPEIGLIHLHLANPLD